MIFIPVTFMSKSISKIVSGFFIFFVFAANSQTPEICLKHLQLGNTTQEHWTPGIVRSNSDVNGGIIYEIGIKVKKGGYITFQNLITEGQVLEVELIKDGKRNAAGPFKKGDEITLIARSDKQRPVEKPDDLTADKLKSKRAAGGILYTIKEKQYLHTVDKFTARQRNALSQ
jgi:hypothetical protein